MRVVFATHTGVIADSHGLPYRIQGGQPWDAEDPLVRQHPNCFTTTPLPQFVSNTKPGASAIVEKTTQEPGELRLSGRGRGA